MAGRKRARLEAAITAGHSDLLRIIRSYALRMRLATPHEAQAIASEILNETVLEALKSAENYDPERRPFSWLLGIAINIIRRRLRKRARTQQHEIAVRDLYPATQAAHSDDELFERFAHLARETHAGHGWSLETRQQIDEWLGPLSEPDRRIIELAILEGLDGKAVAGRLGITPSAARVRLHRALKRLRGHIKLSEGHA